MEKTTATKAKKVTSKEAFQEAYIEYLLTEGKDPNSIFLFAKNLKSSENDFYKYFNSFKSLERSIWASWFEQTLKTIENDAAYVDYSVREKILAFHYTWIELLKNNRSFVMYRFDQLSKRDTHPAFLNGVKPHFDTFINDLILEGKDTTEVAERPFSNQYSKLFWMHFLFICKFWANDESADFEKTDAAIEKSVNLAFDLIGKGALDSLIDFGKFIFQNRPSFR
ncbi:MAG: TetR family transcriptional regulator C-terminal domain-containing protein [Cyclobacteriaceae bacterium]